MTLLQIGQVVCFGVACLAAVVVIVVLVLALLEGHRQRKWCAVDTAEPANQVIVDVFAELRAQRRAAAQDARVELIRAAHAAMSEAERQRGES